SWRSPLSITCTKQSYSSAVSPGLHWNGRGQNPISCVFRPSQREVLFPLFDGFSCILFIFPVNPTPPSIFPLVPCCTKTGNEPPDTSLACLVTGYFPSPVEIKWNSGKVTQGVTTFPEVTVSNGRFTQSSLLIIPARPRQGDTYQCDVTHQETATTESKKFPQECKTRGRGGRHSQTCSWAEMAPKPHAGPSVQGKFRLTAFHPHPHPNPTQPPPTGAGRTKPICCVSPKPQSKTSATLSPGSWPPEPPSAGVTRAGRTVELSLSLEGGWGSTESNTGLCFPLSLLSGCGSTAPPQVHLLVPTCEESPTESQLELVCLLLSFKPDQANVKWLVNGKESSPLTPAFSSAMGTDGFYMGQSRMNVTKQSWEKGDVCTCQVTHPAVGAELSMHNTSKCLGCCLSPGIWPLWDISGETL
uniref:Ig-like domain-containing protein n=1 Tax=Gopherus evgoodei TaxID=1825980 RepID=A0A8C4YSJ7_9SAUR